MRDRNLNIDVLKSISIFGVVFIHGGHLLGCEFDMTEIMRQLFRFAVPCFIIIWTMFLEKGLLNKNKTNEFSYLKKRFVNLFRVYFIWSILYFIILADFSNLTLIKIVTTHFSGYGWAGQYFFVILFQLLFIYPLIRYLYTHKVFRLIILGLSIFLYLLYAVYYDLPILSKLGDRPFVFWILYAFIGIGLARDSIKPVNVIWVLLLFLVPIEFYIKGSYAGSPYILFSLLLSSLLISIYFTKSATFEIRPTFLQKVIAVVGKNTMTIFVANPLAILLSDKIIRHNDLNCSLIPSIVYPFLSTTIIIIICLTLAYFLRLTRLTKIIT
ncbi:fucose 4-O-acetylase-like acetyltransferase [Sphingobacterium allocomposti]|uniref:Fucose 4-O-acetylase-like acetyltransferase n=1 Tax=Sphingobacterium allocomposti TaxID=415956 RepID=A0A5S5D7Q8_9SPHI|nr:fucose 4-O-acetylase-like acetyltransferase [Sphingobacterium composti Yoo et al. 2007 non Ten et al. 2007]